MTSAQFRQLEDDAYASWEAGEYLHAAELFFAADRLEREAASTRSRFAVADRSVLYRARAAYCLWDAGEFERARPVLWEVSLFDWKAGGLWADRHDSEKAYSRLVLEAAVKEDRKRFEELWAAATARGSELAWPFPSIVPEQKKLLAAAMALGKKDACRQVLDRINPKLLAKHHDLQILRKQAQAFCDEG
jgi:hypothetical protein